MVPAIRYVTLARLARSAGFRLALAHAAIFAISIGILFTIVSWATTTYTTRQLADGIRDETANSSMMPVPRGSVLSSTPSRPGWWRRVHPISRTCCWITRVIDWRATCSHPGGARLAGAASPSDRYTGPATEGDVILTLGTVLPDGALLLVGDDTHPVVELRELILRAFACAGGVAVVLALVGGVALGIRLQRRVEAVNLAAARIIDGNLGERIAVRGTDDEFDRLARQLNRMLDRI